ncbi:MAG: hypothetical protein VR64_02655 [Desulfatitalea sp. BRH_c12]|nr:MAG: hypothetical protein VR64_02655 [Desulfatitalea sp. BRH_c12]
MHPTASNPDTKLYRKATRSTHGKIELDAEAARVYAVIDESIQLSKVAELAGVNMAVLWRAIAKLTRLGLIEDSDSDIGYMGKPFFDILHKELTKTVGPISTILLKNVSAKMEISFPHIPVDRVREFVKKLAEQIPDKKAGAQFHQTISKEI